MKLPEPKNTRVDLDDEIETISTLPEPEGEPFLGAKILGDEKSGTITFFGAPVTKAKPGGFSDFVTTVKYKKAEYFFGLKLKSVNYRLLYTLWGDNPKKWKGQLNFKLGTHMGKEYIQLVDPRGA